MKNQLIQKLEQNQMQEHTKVRTGDTVAAEFIVQEGERKKTHTFKGIVISQKRGGLGSPVFSTVTSLEPNTSSFESKSSENDLIVEDCNRAVIGISFLNFLSTSVRNFTARSESPPKSKKL